MQATARIGPTELPVTIGHVELGTTTTAVIGAFVVAGSYVIPMGAITVDRVDHTIELVAVQDDQRRRGIGRALVEAARVAYPELKHSEYRSAAGDGLAKAVGGELPKRRVLAAREAEARANGLLAGMYGLSPEHIVPVTGSVEAQV